MWGEHEALLQGLKLTCRGMECHSDSSHISTVSAYVSSHLLQGALF